MSAAEEMAKALRELLSLNPVFKLKPLGAPNSAVRLGQDAAIKAEDDARAALALYEAEAKKEKG